MSGILGDEGWGFIVQKLTGNKDNALKVLIATEPDDAHAILVKRGMKIMC